MPMLHKNCKEYEFTGLIWHLDGIVLWQEPQFQQKYYHLYGFLYLQILKRGDKALENYINLTNKYP